MRDMPQALNRSITSLVNRGVALGLMLVRSPIDTLYRNKSKMSGRFIGSPPVKTINGSGGPKGARFAENPLLS